jgi:hypothetical protein
VGHSFLVTVSGPERKQLDFLAPGGVRWAGRKLYCFVNEVNLILKSVQEEKKIQLPFCHFEYNGTLIALTFLYILPDFKTSLQSGAIKHWAF